jgi:hypothetical protein
MHSRYHFASLNPLGKTKEGAFLHCRRKMSQISISSLIEGKKEPLSCAFVRHLRIVLSMWCSVARWCWRRRPLPLPGVTSSCCPEVRAEPPLLPGVHVEPLLPRGPSRATAQSKACVELSLPPTGPVWAPVAQSEVRVEPRAQSSVVGLQFTLWPPSAVASVSRPPWEAGLMNLLAHCLPRLHWLVGDNHLKQLMHPLKANVILPLHNALHYWSQSYALFVACYTHNIYKWSNF